MLSHSSPVSMKDRHTHAQTLLFNGVSRQGRRSLPEGESLGESNLISTGFTADDSTLVVSFNTIW